MRCSITAPFDFNTTDPHQSDNLDPDRIRISLQMTSQNAWDMSLFQHQEYEPLFGSQDLDPDADQGEKSDPHQIKIRVRIRIHIRVIRTHSTANWNQALVPYRQLNLRRFLGVLPAGVTPRAGPQACYLHHLRVRSSPRKTTATSPELGALDKPCQSAKPAQRSCRTGPPGYIGVPAELPVPARESTQAGTVSILCILAGRYGNSAERAQLTKVSV